MKASRVSRRKFLKHTAAASAAIALPTYIPARVLGREGAVPPSEQIVIGFIGTGGRARQLMDQVPEGGRIVALADCYQQRLDETLAQKKQPWHAYSDYREMFDKEKLDAVIVATPDHGRTLPCIRAVQAGLDVYAEKPLTAYIREGRMLVDAVRKHKRILQVGSQQRTMEINEFCCRVRPRGQDRQAQEGARPQVPRPAPVRIAARGADARGRRLEHLVRPDAAAAVQQRNCSSAGCNGATTPAAR